MDDEPRTYFEMFKSDESKVRYAAGAVVFEEAQPGEEMYVVVSGRVALRAGTQQLEEVGPGGVFGEMALVDAAPRSATAVAIEECELVKINAKRFEFFLKRVPYFAVEVMKLMAGRLRRQTPHD